MNFYPLSVITFLFLSFTTVIGAEVNIYSHRQPFLINPFLEKFTEETGIKTNVVYATKGLAQRLKAEGKNGPADVILTVDIGRLYIYDDLDLLASVNSDILDRNIPQNLKSPEQVVCLIKTITDYSYVQGQSERGTNYKNRGLSQRTMERQGVFPTRKPCI